MELHCGYTQLQTLDSRRCPPKNANSLEKWSALSNFIVSCCAALNDFQIEIQSEACKRVIGVNSNKIAVDSHNLNNLGIIACVDLKLHTDAQVLYPLKHRARHLADQILSVLTIGHGRRHSNLQTVPRVAIFNGLLNTFDDIGAAVQKM